MTENQPEDEILEDPTVEPEPEPLTPADFVLARLTEDDETALAVPTWGDPMSADPFIRHVCRHFPDRVQRRTNAERILLASADETAVLALARVWSDHEDFDPAWGAE